MITAAPITTTVAPDEHRRGHARVSQFPVRTLEERSEPSRTR